MPLDQIKEVSDSLAGKHERGGDGRHITLKEYEIGKGWFLETTSKKESKRCTGSFLN